MNNKGIWPIAGMALVAIVSGFVLCVTQLSNKEKAKNTPPVAVAEVKPVEVVNG